MPKQSLKKVTDYCNSFLKIQEINDWPGAVNGLQVTNSGQISKIGAAVDVSPQVINKAIEFNVDFLIVHHGLFWNSNLPLVGQRYQMLKNIFSNNIAIYSAHLPLDNHPTIGNNVLLAKKLGLKHQKPLVFDHGQWLGILAETKLPRQSLYYALNKLFNNSVRLIPFGPETCTKIGIITGAAGDLIKQVAQSGVDTFITGEGHHWSFTFASEIMLNVFYCGHYLSETFGVKALADHLSKRFKLPWVFIDCPTGL